MDKKEKLRPEVAVARECNLAGKQMKWLVRKGKDFGLTNDELSKKIEEIISLERTNIEEVQDRFVAPKLKNKNPRNLEAGFRNWYSNWNNYLNGLSEEEHKKLEVWEKNYKTFGSNLKYENFQIPPEFKNEFIDLSDEEWEAFAPLSDDKKPLLKQFVANLQKINTKKESQEVGKDY